MTLEEFEDLVDRCGEAPAGWPQDVRQEALRFLADSQQAREIVAEAAALRAMFGASVAEPAPANLAGRIVALAGRMDDIQPPLAKDLKPRAPLVPGRQPFFNRLGPPKSYLWLVACFGLGLGLGLAHGYAVGGSNIDFASLFAAVGS